MLGDPGLDQSFFAGGHTPRIPIGSSICHIGRKDARYLNSPGEKYKENRPGKVYLKKTMNIETIVEAVVSEFASMLEESFEKG